MKKIIALGMILSFICYLKGPILLAAETTSEIQAGESVADVVAKLGEPKGMIEQGRKATYNYDLGLIDFENGRVVRVNLMTPEQAEQIKLDRARAEEESRRQAEAERKRVAEAGQAELQKRLADSSFAQRSPAKRLAYWQEFSKLYPYTDAKAYLSKAALEVEAQQRENERRKDWGRIADIHARLNQLDVDYAASLTRWKREEIDSEKNKLHVELTNTESRLSKFENQGLTNAVPGGK